MMEEVEMPNLNESIRALVRDGIWAIYRTEEHGIVLSTGNSAALYRCAEDGTVGDRMIEHLNDIRALGILMPLAKEQ